MLVISVLMTHTFLNKREDCEMSTWIYKRMVTFYWFSWGNCLLSHFAPWDTQTSAYNLGSHSKKAANWQHPGSWEVKGHAQGPTALQLFCRGHLILVFVLYKTHKYKYIWVVLEVRYLIRWCVCKDNSPGQCCALTFLHVPAESFLSHIFYSFSV